MGVNKLFWCDNCHTFETIEDAEILIRPVGWTRVEVSSAARTELMHFCHDCTEKLRNALAVFFQRRPQ